MSTLRIPLSCLLTLVPTACLAAQDRPASWTPAQPVAGATLQVRYQPPARMAHAGELFAIATFITDGGSKNAAARLRPAGGSLQATLPIPADANYAHLGVTSRTVADPAARLATMIHGTDGAPRRGARLRTVFEHRNRLEQVIAAELTAFPDNYAAYRMKWFAMSGGNVDEATRKVVAADLLAIGDADSASALWARSYGHLLLREEPPARALVLQALARWPTEFAAARAVRDYEYQCYAQGITGPPVAAVQGRKLAVIREHPETWLARSEIRVVSADEAFPLAATERVCRAWCRDEPDNPEPKYVLARALWQHGEDLPRAAQLSREAANGYLRGDTRLCGDAAGSLQRHMLPAALHSAAEIALASGDLAGALGYAQVARRVTTHTSSRGHEVEARVWERIGDPRAAARSWSEALSAGSKTAETELRRLHRAASDHRAFEAWLDTIASDDTGGRRAAPDFQATDIDGQPVQLASLRGKVVVLNFWGLGCAPCKVEIPDLNRLVEKFAGQPVEFLALGTDPAAAIRAYLLEHPFRYRQLPGAGRIAGRFRVQGWPTHVIIDKRGRIAATFVGGGKGVDGRFRALIARLLREAD